MTSRVRTRKIKLMEKEVQEKFKNRVFIPNQNTEDYEDDGQSIGEQTSLSF